MNLPTFAFHPDPLHSGSVIASDIRCRSCQRARGYIYTGPVYAQDALDDSICPWCIADGKATAALGATFVDPEAFAEGIPEQERTEIEERTPGYSTWQSERWPACCGGATSFVEPVGITEIRQRFPGLEMQALSSIIYDLHVSGGAAHCMLESLHRDIGPTAYVFRCRRCGSLQTFVDGILE